MEVRWLARLAPPLAAIAALVALVAPPAASGGTWDPPPCAAGSASAAVTGSTGTLEELDGRPWYRLDPALAADASLAGERLALGQVGRDRGWVMALPAESSAAGPFGATVAVTTDDGRTSEIALVDVAARCRRVVAREAAVVRRVTVDPAGRWLFEARVDRATRADLGVWRRPLDGGPASSLVSALPHDPRFGRTFSTELSWDVSGSTLVVESCGALACRVRLVDPDSGTARLVADPTLGPIVGVTADRVVAHEACRGLPCPVLAVDPATGGSRRLATAAGAAALVSDHGRVNVVVEEAPGALGVLDVASGVTRGHVRLPAGLALAAPASRTGAGSAAPAGWLLLAADARGFGGAGAVAFVRPADGRITRLPEVSR